MVHHLHNTIHLVALHPVVFAMVVILFVAIAALGLIALWTGFTGK